MLGGEGVIDLQRLADLSLHVPQFCERNRADLWTKSVVRNAMASVQIVRVEFAQKPDRVDPRGGDANHGTEVDLEGGPAQSPLQPCVG